MTDYRDEIPLRTAMKGTVIPGNGGTVERAKTAQTKSRPTRDQASVRPPSSLLRDHLAAKKEEQRLKLQIPPIGGSQQVQSQQEGSRLTSSHHKPSQLSKPLHYSDQQAQALSQPSRVQTANQTLSNPRRPGNNVFTQGKSNPQVARVSTPIPFPSSQSQEPHQTFMTPSSKPPPVSVVRPASSTAFKRLTVNDL